ncbi:MAG: hypothetical protein UW71_C0025G0007, partial [Parcubacteria group bacterium GW2011_GWB1_44_7]
ASMASVALNIVSALFLIQVFASSNAFSQFFVSFLRLGGIEDVRILALPLAFVVAGVFQLGLLSLLLARKIRDMFEKEFLVSLAKTALAAFTAGIVTYGVLYLYGNPFPLETYLRVLTQFLLAGFAGALTFIAAAFALKSPEVFALWSKTRSLLSRSR